MYNSRLCCYPYIYYDYTNLISFIQLKLDLIVQFNLIMIKHIYFNLLYNLI